MSYSTTEESFPSLASYWKDPAQRLQWDCVFALPVWMEVWWREFQPAARLLLLSVKEGNEVIGIAPFQVTEDTASFVGNVDVCDYGDFVVVPGREDKFFSALFDNLKSKGIKQLDLKHVRPDSTAFTKLAEWARRQGHDVSAVKEAISVEMDLPRTFEEYMAGITSKQRHEIGRKLRRLGEMGKVEYRTIQDVSAARKAMDTFMKLFSESRRDKAAFLTPKMESFFRAVVDGMGEAGLLRIGVLELDGVAMAMVMAFDINGIIHLYNSGYDPQYSYLSAGVLSKLYCIKDSIEKGRKKFDFLKGAETYKYHLGGKEVPLYACRVTLK